MNHNRYNSIYKKNYFLLIFFIILSIFSVIKLIDNAVQLDAWQYGEWLINYQNGFVRRGLIGEGIYLFSVIFDNNLQLTFILIISIIVLLYYYLNYLLLKGIEHNFINYFIIFSPLFYLFLVVISKIGIKKEIILYIFYLLYLIHLSKKNFNIKKNWIFILLFPFLLLNHEGQFFYLPYLIVPLIFLIKKNEMLELKFQSLVLIIISSLVLIMLYNYKGTLEHTLTICQSLGKYVPAKCDWWGPIFALSLNPTDDWSGNFNIQWVFSYIHNDYKAYFGFLFYILYSFLPFYFFFKFVNFKKNKYLINEKRFFYILVTLFIYSLPLFHLGDDWSRWFSIHFHLLAFLIFFFQRMKLIDFQNNLSFIKLNNNLINQKMRKYFFIFLFFYATSFHHLHFFWEGVRLEFTYYKIYKKFTNNY